MRTSTCIEETKFSSEQPYSTHSCPAPDTVPVEESKVSGVSSFSTSTLSSTSSPTSTPMKSKSKSKSKSKYKCDRVLLITGGAGFLGSHIVRYMLETHPSYKVIVYDKLTYCSSRKSVIEAQKQYPSRVILVERDVCDASSLSKCITEHSVDCIVHAAAETHVDRSFQSALLFTQTNVIGTQTVLECAKKHSSTVRLVVHVSTDEVYGESSLTADERGKSEQCLMAPTNPYASSKAAAELYVQGYGRSFKVPFLIVRPNNCYGPGQFPEKLIPKFVSLLNQGRKVCLYGDGSNLRCYLHARDLASAIDTLILKGEIGQTYNVGSETELSNNFVAKVLIDRVKGLDRSMESTAWKEHANYVLDRPHNDARYLIDSSKIRSLGWKQSIDFERGIDEVIEWYLGVDLKGYWNCERIDDALIATPHAVEYNPTAHSDRSSPSK